MPPRRRARSAAPLASSPAGSAEKIRFTSSILPKWARRTKSLDALLPVLYLRGVSTGDFQEALAALLGKAAPNLSPAVISRLTAEWQADYDAWQRRDLSARQYVYVWADGVYLQARMEPAAECMLVLIGATPEGKKELVGFQTGVRESTQSWRELLIDIKQRGLEIQYTGDLDDGTVRELLGIGGMIGPLMFGFFMDHGAPRWVFGASVIVMIAVALVALVGDRRSARRRRFAAAE